MFPCSRCSQLALFCQLNPCKWIRIFNKNHPKKILILKEKIIIHAITIIITRKLFIQVIVHKIFTLLSKNLNWKSYSRFYNSKKFKLLLEKLKITPNKSNWRQLHVIANGFQKTTPPNFKFQMKFYIKKLIIKFAVPHHRNPQSTYALEAILLCPCSHSCHTLIQLSWHSFIVVQLYCLSVVQSQLWLFSHSFKYGGAVISVCLLCRLMDGVSARWAVCLVLSKRGRLMPKISHAAVLICSTVPLGLALVSVCSLIHSIHYLGSSGVCLLSMHGPKNIFLCFLSYSSPLPYPTLSLPHFFFFFFVLWTPVLHYVNNTNSCICSWKWHLHHFRFFPLNLWSINFRLIIKTWVLSGFSFLLYSSFHLKHVS